MEKAMNFDDEYLSNKLFCDYPLSYDYYSSNRTEEEKQTGATIRNDGSVMFRLYAPGIHHVSMKIIINRMKTYDYEFEKTGDFFEFLLENDGRFNGPLDLILFFDGVHLLYPQLPICWSGDTASNYLEFPTHKLDFCLLKDVPHGSVSTKIYYAKELGCYERALVYTPPGYDRNDTDYPVLYLQHGGGENETSWESFGKLSTIMDNAIAEKRCVPFLVVMNNGMVRYPGTDPRLRDKAFEDSFLGSCIPFIEKEFRAQRDKYSRAIAGLSMGSYQANDIALGHPNMFAYVGAFTGCMYHGNDPQASYVCPWKRVMVDEEGEAVKKGFRVFYQSATTLEDYMDYVKTDHLICEKNGVADMPGYRFVIHSDNETKWTSWRMGLNEFIGLLFRE